MANGQFMIGSILIISYTAISNLSNNSSRCDPELNNL